MALTSRKWQSCESHMRQMFIYKSFPHIIRRGFERLMFDTPVLKTKTSNKI